MTERQAKRVLENADKVGLESYLCDWFNVDTMAEVAAIAEDGTIEERMVFAIASEDIARETTAATIRAFIVAGVGNPLEATDDDRKEVGKQMRALVRNGHTIEELEENGGKRLYNAACQAFKRFWKAIDDLKAPEKVEEPEVVTTEEEPEHKELPEGAEQAYENALTAIEGIVRGLAKELGEGTNVTWESLKLSLNPVLAP